VAWKGLDVPKEVARVYDNIIDSRYRTSEISNKNKNPHGTHIYEINIVESGKYIG